jgi:S1-C subfamily serine protease
MARNGALINARKAYEKGNCRKTISEIAQAESYSEIPDTQKPFVSLMRAMCYERLGHRDLAIGVYQYISNSFPNSEHALSARSRLKALGQTSGDTQPSKTNGQQHTYLTTPGSDKEPAIGHQTQRPKATPEKDTSMEPLDQAQIPKEDIPAIIKRIVPSVVTILAILEDGKAVALGSGFFIDNSSHVITSYHVLKGANRAEIRMADGKIYPIKQVVAWDKEGDLIKVSVEIPPKDVRPLLVSTSIPEVGEHVIVFGNPLGLAQTVTDGIVSAIRDTSSSGRIIQISAPLSKGSSGGPVVNMKGEVVGVVSFQFVQGQNLNFSVSGERVRKLVPNVGIPIGQFKRETQLK